MLFASNKNFRILRGVRMSLDSAADRSNQNGVSVGQNSALTNVLGFIGVGLLVLAVLLLVFNPFGVGTRIYGFYESVVNVVTGNPDVTAAERQWYEEDGLAVRGDHETPFFPTWVNSQYNWPDTVEVYSGEWGEGYTLAGVEGLQAGDTIFVAMRDVQKWVYSLDYSVQIPATWDSSDSVHLECAGTLIPSYNPSTMGGWQIPNSTVVKVVGNDRIPELLQMAKAWAAIRASLEGGCP
jgi:hypothetical protein